ncbi:MAG: Rab family GTPase [Candidatus Thorarchaeota archaeon]
MNRQDATATKPSSEEFSGYKFRVVLIGEAGVGKTSLLRRFTENAFEEQYKKTIGTTFASKDVQVLCDDGLTRDARLVIWDMGGQDTYKELRRRFMKGAAGAIIVYDVTRPETFMAMNNWYESFRETCPTADAIICANKVDLEEQRMVPEEPGFMLRDWFQADYFETSAKTGQLVTDVFARLAEIMLLKKLRELEEPRM